jgi:YaiO family outer membrane protein
MASQTACTGLATLAALALGARGVDAQAVPDRAAPVRRADLVVDHHRVTGGFGDWTSVSLVLALPAASRASAPSPTIWHVEGIWRRAFGDAGGYAALGVQQQLGRDWFAQLAAGAGSGDFIFPDARVDLSVSRRWLSGRNLVTTAGAGLVDAKRGFRDRSVLLSLALYARPGLVIEAGARHNQSLPGDVTSRRAFGALTLGTDRRRYVVVRGSTGDEGYQLVGPQSPLVTFHSREAGISWREWLGGNWGALLRGEHYTNPHYDRTGVAGGFFVHW